MCPFCVPIHKKKKKISLPAACPTCGSSTAAPWQRSPVSTPFTQQFSYCRQREWTSPRLLPYLLKCYPPTVLLITDLEFLWIMALSPPSTTSSLASVPAPMDSSALRSFVTCHRRMSSLKYDLHTICSQCRDVVCSITARCDECRNWSNYGRLCQIT